LNQIRQFRSAPSLREFVNIGERRICNVSKRFSGEKGLMRRDHDIVECYQPCQHVVGQHFVRYVVEEDARLLFVYVQSGRPDLAGFQSADKSPCNFFRRCLSSMLPSPRD
jgi:hypothetical protein